MAVTSRVIEGGRTSITQPYHINGQKGYNYDHWGIDLTGFNGSYNVLAWELAHSDGVVMATRNNCTGFEQNSYGNYVLLKHSNGYYTMYAHMAYNTVQVRVGQTVKRGQRLGYMGNTGTSYGGHLHFEVRTPSGYKIDPQPYLNADLPSSGGGGGVGNGWLPPVTGYNTADFNNGFAGNYKAISCVAVRDPNIKYRVKIKSNQRWLPWVYGKNYNLNDKENGYAGIKGQIIDEMEFASLDGRQVRGIAYDTVQGRWLPEVVNTTVVNDTIGVKGHAMGGVALKSPTLTAYCVYNG